MRIILSLLLCAAAHAQSRTFPIMTTVAGGNPSRFDNNGASTENAFSLQGVAVDKAGNVYFAEFFGGNVRRVNMGIHPGFRGINTVAGVGYSSFFQVGETLNGDGGLATLAPLAQPQRFAFDSAGNLYILDIANSTLNRMNPDGTLTIVAGSGYGSPSSGDGGPAKKAILKTPRALAIDRSNDTIYISDSDGLIIRKIANGIITTIAGKGTPGFSGDNGPAVNATFSRVSGLAVDSNGTLYLAADNRIRTITADGIIRTIAGTGANVTSGDGGPATAAAIGGARTLTFDGAGNLYVCQLSLARIRKIDKNGIITTVAGGGTQPPPATALSAQLLAPDDIALDALGRLYITDGDLNEVLVVDTDGMMSVLVSPTQPSYPNAKSARFLQITSIAVDPQGTTYIADQNDGRFWQVNPDGSLQVLLNAGRGAPVKVAADAAGNVYVAVVVNSQTGQTLQIRKRPPGGSFATLASVPLLSNINNRGGMAIDGAGNVFVSANAQVFRITPGGTVTPFAGSGTPGSSGDGGPAVQAQLTQPNGVALKSDGSLYIADAVANAVRFVTPDGIIHSVNFHSPQGTHQDEDFPNDVAFDSKGNLYVGDGFNDHVNIVPAGGGTPRFYAGGLGGVYNGDGLPADIAPLGDVNGLAIDKSDNLYIGDNFTVRKVSQGTLNQ